MLIHAKNFYRGEFCWEGFKNFCLILAGVLLCLFVVQTGILIVTYLLPFRSVEAADIPVPEMVAPKIESLKSFEKKISLRNLFFSPQAPAPPAPVNQMDEKLKNLKLIGVITSGEPEAIVKDTSLNQTYFLKKRQRLRDLEVIEVKVGSIVLKHGNDEKELHLE